MPENQSVILIGQAEENIRWHEIQALIFDVDGTLYHQLPVRLRMAFRLARYYGTHLSGLQELKGISCFRRIREEEAFQAVSLDKQILEAARRSGADDADKLKAAIQRWMFKEPLDAIAAHPRKNVISLLRRRQAEGKRIIIYSDYAAEEKLAALCLTPDAVYYPGTMGMTEMKPSRKCMELILSREGIRADQAVMVGDRPEKDGKSAELAGMRFIYVL